ncbi:MAG: hypothetical protein JW996_03935, partial [Candidatus Cloacimonetes bacterium]|nr:hypothetical protein [Candidatus Cloacimonadota bacterium]
VCRELDYLRVKGKTMPTRIYELLDYSDKPGKTEQILKYEQALQSYRDGNFKQAAAYFRELSDNAAKVMLDRCDYLLKNPPEKWDGILTLEVK